MTPISDPNRPNSGYKYAKYIDVFKARKIPLKQKQKCPTTKDSIKMFMEIEYLFF